MYVRKPPALRMGSEAQTLEVPWRPASWTLNHTALEGLLVLAYHGNWWIGDGVKVLVWEKKRKDILSSWHILITSGIRAPGHVGNDRTNVAVGPERPVKLDFGASCCWSVQSSRRRPLDAAGSVTAALKVRQSYVLHGPVALDGTRDALYAAAHVRVGVGLVEGVFLATDRCIVYVAVGRDGRDEGEQGGKVSHCWLIVRSEAKKKILRKNEDWR